MIAPRKVMIVDDEHDIIATIKLALKSQGYEVDGFTSPIDAMKKFTEDVNAYALVVSDVRMPGMSGFDLAKKIRAINPDLPIVLMTAFEINNSEFSQTFSSTSVSELVAKPFTNTQLIGIVRKYVGVTEQY
jgi:DNA-binding NtrC family response regulator